MSDLKNYTIEQAKKFVEDIKDIDNDLKIFDTINYNDYFKNINKSNQFLFMQTLLEELKSLNKDDFQCMIQQITLDYVHKCGFIDNFPSNYFSK